jgi:hypothetical protein
MKLIAVTLGVLAVTAAAATAVTPASGLYGSVKRGPITPVCIAGKPCSAPARHVVLSFTNEVGTVTTTRTSADGTYRVRLYPATYRVSTSSGRISPSLVHVVRRLVHVNFRIDTGIR